MELFGMILVIAGWFVVQSWLLPKLGVPT